MKPVQKKLIHLALFAIGFIFVGTEIAIVCVSDSSYSTNQIRPWFAILVGAIYYVWAHQISATSKNESL